MPKWVLFNGAVGTIKEILFEENKNPNHGNLPTAVIVDFSGHVGPKQDKNNLTVRNEQSFNAIKLGRDVPVVIFVRTITVDSSDLPVN